MTTTPPSAAQRQMFGSLIFALGAICLLMAFVFYRILRLPQLPYNVVELFLGNGAFPFLMILSQPSKQPGL